MFKRIFVILEQMKGCSLSTINKCYRFYFPSRQAAGKAIEVIFIDIFQ